MKRRRSSDGAPVSVDGYGELERIGSGGFSVVYRARQVSMNREVAIKVLNSSFASEAERRTFERECHALGQLSHHPNIVTVFNDAITTDGRPCIVMELYRTTYRQRIGESGPVPVGEALSTGVRIAGALQVAHEHGVLHRDIKPHNIFVSQYGEPALGDFGISTLDDERSHSGASGLSVAYAAPEILEDSAAETASDVYSLAATLYHLVAGTSPFASAELRTTVRRILSEPPPSVDRADCPPGLSRVLARAMSKDPADRPASAYEFAEMLREVQARAGLARTPVPMSGVEPPPPVDSERHAGALLAPSSPSSMPIDENRSAPPPPVEARQPLPEAGGDQTGSATVARRREAPPPPPVEEVGPDRRRMWIATGGAAAALLLVVAGVVAFGGGGGGSETPPTASPPPIEVVPFLPAPQNVEVLPAGNGFNVHFELPVGSTGAVIEIHSELRRGEKIEAESSPHHIRYNGQSLCVRVVALGQGGRRSGESEVTCP
jgi:serine/threonine protein kinase